MYLNLDGYLRSMNRGQGDRNTNTDNIRIHFLYKRYSSFSILFHYRDEGDHRFEA